MLHKTPQKIYWHSIFIKKIKKYTIKPIENRFLATDWQKLKCTELHSEDFRYCKPDMGVSWFYKKEYLRFSYNKILYILCTLKIATIFHFPFKVQAAKQLSRSSIRIFGAITTITLMQLSSCYNIATMKYSIVITLSNSVTLGRQLTWIHRPVDLLKFTKKCTIHYRHLQVSFNIKLTYIQLVIRNGYIAYHIPKFKTNDINWCWYNTKQDKLTTFKDSFIFLCTRTIFKNE